MPASETMSTTLTAPQPRDPASRLLLFGVRQMGAHGLEEACTAHAFMVAFGKGFRRPLVLLRALVSEMSAISARPIPIAPWCCSRMTGCEATMLAVLGRVRQNPAAAGLLLADMLGVRDATAVLTTASALAGAFEDFGLPFEA